jgi:tetratricopeptide (TPR) repeat protein
MLKNAVFVTCILLLTTHLQAQELYSQQRQERLYKIGLELLQKKDFAAAKTVFEELQQILTNTDYRRIESEYFSAFCSLNLYHQNGEKLVLDFIEEHPEAPLLSTVYLDLANFFYNEKNYQKSTEYYTKVKFESLNSKQQNSARFKWGYSLFTQKKLAESLNQFNLIKSFGGQFGPASSYYAGFIEYNNADFESAVLDLKRAGENESYALIVPYLIASCYYQQAKYDELIKFTNTISNGEVSNRNELYLLMAEANFKKEDYTKAIEGYKNYLSTTPTLNKGILARAGFAAYTTGMDDDALNYFKSAASNKDSVGFYASYYVGNLYLKKKQKALALTAFEVAKKFRADKKIAEEAAFQFSKIAFDLGRGDVALDGLESFIKSYPVSEHLNEAKELLSQAYVTTNNYDKAIGYIESLDRNGEALDKAYQKACFHKATDFFNSDNYDQAKIYFKKSLSRQADLNYSAEANLWLGEITSQSKLYEEAINYYKKVVENVDFKSEEVILKARYGLGYAYFNLEQFDKALVNFKEIVAKTKSFNANAGDALIRLADCYYVTKLYTDAIASYKKSIAQKIPDADYAYLQLGNVFSISANYKEAAENLDVVIAKYPASRFHDEALFQRAQLDFEQGNYSMAVVGFTKLIQEKSASNYLPYAYVRRASSYHNLKAFEKTVNDYVSVIELYTNHPVINEILLPLQEALNEVGKIGEFDKYLNLVKAANPNAKGVEAVEFESSKGFYFSQEYSKAIKSLTSFIESYPQSPKVEEANYYRAESYYRLKEFAKALPIYYTLSALDNFSFASKVIARVAEIEFKNGNYQVAIPYFTKLSKQASTKKELFSSWSGLMESHYYLSKYDSVTLYARAILDKAKVNAGAENKASLYLGKAALGKGDLEAAKDEFLNTINNAQDEFGAEAKYLLGEIQFKNKEYKACYQTLTSLNTDFSSYPLWRGKAYLLLADYFLALNDRFNARASLQSLLDNTPILSIKEKAKEKLSQLDKDELKPLSSDTLK